MHILGCKEPSIPVWLIVIGDAAKENKASNKPERNAPHPVSPHFLFAGGLDLQRILEVLSAGLSVEHQRSSDSGNSVGHKST